MNCLLIFDHLNDIIFTKCNEKFAKHINTFASEQGLIPEESIESNVEDNIIVQIFSPIITSHRIMHCQFGNSYTSIQCEDNLNIYFDEFMGYLFVAIGNEDDSFMKRFIGICVTIIRYLCGPDVFQLKIKEDISKLAHRLINNWIYLQDNDQSILLEAVEQLVVNSEINGVTLQALRESIDKLSPQVEYNKIHAMILVQNKFLSLYSRQNAKDLSSADILFSILLCHGDEADDELESSNVTGNIFSYQLLLAGPERQPKCLPHVIHNISIYKGVNLIYLIEIGNPAVAAAIYETFCHLHTMQQVQIQRERATMQLAFENLDIATRRLNDSLKKNKNSSIENSHKQLVKKWEVIKKKYQDYLKNNSDESLLRAETLSLGFLENLKELLNLTNINDGVLKASQKVVKEIANGVKEKLKNFEEFLRAKTIKNFSLGSKDSLTINKYLEEFPGLVHFLYIDRNIHRVTMPTLDFTTEEGMFTKKKIWSMINFARIHAQEGNLSILWKDTTFNYAYFLWFEDSSGAPLKPAVHPTGNLPLPGILCEDFYEKLKETCFPKMTSNKIKCYELLCIHLGLVTASCVLEQMRRLTATVWELKGFPSQAIDLL